MTSLHEDAKSSHSANSTAGQEFPNSARMEPASKSEAYEALSSCSGPTTLLRLPIQASDLSLDAEPR
jgi:hypothetical protein